MAEEKGQWGAAVPVDAGWGQCTPSGPQHPEEKPTL